MVVVALIVGFALGCIVAWLVARERVRAVVGELERERQKTVGAMSEGLRRVAETSERVRLETANLATALRAPEVRGAWGQMQLQNAVEAAGMIAHCDFLEEVSVNVDDGRLRPDL